MSFLVDGSNPSGLLCYIYTAHFFRLQIKDEKLTFSKNHSFCLVKITLLFPLLVMNGGSFFPSFFLSSLDSSFLPSFPLLSPLHFLSFLLSHFLFLSPSPSPPLPFSLSLSLLFSFPFLSMDGGQRWRLADGEVQEETGVKLRRTQVKRLSNWTRLSPSAQPELSPSAQTPEPQQPTSRP